MLHDIADIDAAVLRRRLEQGERIGFHFSNLHEIPRLADLLSGFSPSPMTVSLGLLELMVNAVEHGCLGINHQEKLTLRREGLWEEEVARRAALAENRGRHASISLTRNGPWLTYAIADPGEGFDWRPYLDFDPERAEDYAGRGIALAVRLAFDRVEFLGRGNVVLASVGMLASQA